VYSADPVRFTEELLAHGMLHADVWSQYQELSATTYSPPTHITQTNLKNDFFRASFISFPHQIHSLNHPYFKASNSHPPLHQHITPRARSIGARSYLPRLPTPLLHIRPQLLRTLERREMSAFLMFSEKHKVAVLAEHVLDNWHDFFGKPARAERLLNGARNCARGFELAVGVDGGWEAGCVWNELGGWYGGE
jgi:hypothetical protein